MTTSTQDRAPDIPRRMTLDTARLLANVNFRAARLFESGYRIQTIGEMAGERLYIVRRIDGPDYHLRVALDARGRETRSRCDCPFFVGHSGRLPCKHALGRVRLLLSQRTHLDNLARRIEAVPVRDRLDETIDRAKWLLEGSLRHHLGNLLEEMEGGQPATIGEATPCR